MKILQRLLALSFAVLACASLARAADVPTRSSQIDTSAQARQSAPVTLANRTIIVLRGPIAGYSAREQASSAQRRIDDILDKEESPAVSTEESEDGTNVLLGATRAFLVTRIDIDPLIGETTQNVARAAARRLQRAEHAMLQEAAGRTADIARSPAPYVRQTALSDLYVEYHLIAYSPIDHPVQRIDMLSELHANIQDVFNEHGVQIMSPHYMTETAEPQIVPRENWYLEPAKPPGKGAVGDN